MPESDQRPIGIFDSGLGGLSVLREIRNRLPHEDILYFADSAHCPYGERRENEIRDLTGSAVKFLLQQGCKLVVIACNTASATSLSYLRKTFRLPVVGLEPAFKPAAEQTRNGRVGILATEVTVRAQPLQDLQERFGQGIQAIARPCPGLVEIIEQGVIDGELVRRLLAGCLAPMKEAGVDTLVLGCTHYPFVRDTIAQVMGNDVIVIDSGAAVARQVERVLDNEHAVRTETSRGRTKAFTSGDPGVFEDHFIQLLGYPVPVAGVRWRLGSWLET